MSKLEDRGAADINRAVKVQFDEGVSDYHLKPIVLCDEEGAPIGRVKDGDSVIMALRRGEREIQLTEVFTDNEFNEFKTEKFSDLEFVIMTLYHDKFRSLPVAFAPVSIPDTVGEVVSRAGMKQLRAAESEKFPHITYFFSGGKNEPYPGEDRIFIKSHSGISFDEVPEMKIGELTEKLTTAIKSNEYDFIAANLANGDVVGHIDNPDAKVKCAGVVDEHMGILVKEAQAAGYVTIITADHGVLEMMKKPDGSPNVGHTDANVPFIFIDPALPAGHKVTLKEGCVSSNAAVTVLEVLGLEKPEIMDRDSLLNNYPESGEQRKLLFLVLDGWGIGKQDDSNPIFLGDTKNMDRFTKEYPYTELRPAGEDVGLKKGKKGNSEAGHINLMAGRIVLQDDVRVDMAMKDGSLYENEAFTNAIDRAKEKKTDLHIIGHLSDKSSHGTMDYPLALLKMAKDRGFKKAFVHIIFDGRSTEPGSAPDHLLKFQEEMDKIGLGTIVTGVGRGYALDRDRNWTQKTKPAYDALVYAKGIQV